MSYKIGDKVRIKSTDWYNENKDKHGIVICGMMPFCGYMSCRCGTIVTISEILEYGYCIEEDYGENGWTDEMIEGLVEKKKKEYPKTYEECAKILDCFSAAHIDGYKNALLEKLQELLVCRDAYWQIAGEEMRLDIPWEPDWTDDNAKYSIYTIKGVLTKAISCYDGAIFVFPTEEMRDAFYENFKELINECKELL